MLIDLKRRKIIPFKKKTLLGLGLLCHIGTVAYASAEKEWDFSQDDPSVAHFVLQYAPSPSELTSLLTQTTSLRILNLDVCRYREKVPAHDEGKLMALAQGLRGNTTLTRLGLNGFGLVSNAHFAEVLNATSGITSLESLNLQNCELGPEAVLAIGVFLNHHTGFSDLNVSACVTPNLPQDIIEKQFIPALTSAGIRGLSLGVHGEGNSLITPFMSLVKESTTLTSLSCKVPVVAEGQQGTTLEDLLRHPTLETLNLRTYDTYDVSHAGLSALRTNTSLTSLALEGTPSFAEQSGAAFSDVLRHNTALVSIRMNHPVGLSMLKIGAAMHHNSTLHSLKLAQGTKSHEAAQRNAHNFNMRELSLFEFIMNSLNHLEIDS